MSAFTSNGANGGSVRSKMIGFVRVRPDAEKSGLSVNDPLADVSSNRLDRRVPKRVTIYMPLLNEGTAVWSPVKAEQVTDDCFTVLGPASQDEDWAFPPGTVVRCEDRVFSNGKAGLVAVEGVWRNLKTTFLEYLERRAATEPEVRDLLERTDNEALSVTSGVNLTHALRAKGATSDHLKEVNSYFQRYARAMVEGGQPRRLQVRSVP